MIHKANTTKNGENMLGLSGAKLHSNSASYLMPLNLLTFLKLPLWSRRKKTRALYLSWFNHGGPKKFKITIFQQAKLSYSKIFGKNSRIFKKFSGDEFKS